MSDQIREIVLNIYDTVADQSLWPSVLDRVAEQINAEGCIIFEWQNLYEERRLTAPFICGSFPPEVIHTYLDKCFQYEAIDQDIFEAHSLESDGINLIDDSVISNSKEELMQRENVKILQKFGILHRAAGLLNKDNIAESRFSVQLGVTRGPLIETERKYLAMVLPHIAKALDIGRPAMQLAKENRSIMSAMDRLTVGVCILDPAGNIAVCNEEFKRQQDIYRVFGTSTSGALKFFQPNDQKRFAALKADVFNHGKFGARPRKEAISTSADTFLCIELIPLNNSDDIGSADFRGFILYSTDTSLSVHCNTLPIKYAYGLTDTELSLVEAIGEGLTNVQIAERRGRSVSTINGQVKSILSKSHCSTRTQFVRLMMSFGANYIISK